MNLAQGKVPAANVSPTMLNNKNCLLAVFLPMRNGRWIVPLIILPIWSHPGVFDSEFYVHIP
jgi:hypothetical protein